MTGTQVAARVEHALGNSWLVFANVHQPRRDDGLWALTARRGPEQRVLLIPDTAINVPGELSTVLHRQMVKAA